MSRTIRISGGLYASMVASYMYAAPALFLPGPLVAKARMDAWLSVLLSGMVATLVALLVGWIGLQFGRQSAVAAARLAMGKVLGGTVGLCYAAFAIWICSLVMRDVEDFLAVALLPRTPGIVVPIGLGLVMLYAVWSGLEPLVRISFPAIMAAVISQLFLPVLLAREYSFLHLEPLLFRGFRPVLEASAATVPFFGEVILLFTLIPHLSRPKDLYRWTVIGISGAILMITEIVGLTVLIFGPVLPSRLMLPSYDLARQISLAQILERMDLVLVVFWLATMFVKAGFYLYAAADATAAVLGVRSHRIPAAILLVVAVLLTQTWQGMIPFFSSAGSPAWITAHAVWEGGVLLLFGIAALLLRVRRQGSGHA